jgi:ABC-type dipeptide/oligopeptide/nickel transport system permease subunit
VAPHDSVGEDIIDRLGRPVLLDGGTTRNLLGTDPLGRYVLGRLVDGARVVVIVGMTAVPFFGAPGLAIGLVAG